LSTYRSHHVASARSRRPTPSPPRSTWWSAPSPHGWDCPNWVAPVHDPLSSSHQGEEKKMMSVASRWSLAPWGHRQYDRWRASLLVHGVYPEDPYHHGPPPCRQPHRPLPSPRWTVASTSFKRGRPFGLRDAVGSQESMRQLAAPSVRPPRRPHPAKAERLGLGTRRSGLADEQPRKRGSGVEELGRVDKVRRQRRSLRGGGLNPVTASHHRRQGQAPQADRRRGATAEERGVRLGLTLIAPPF
jgi:hypothetical protein